MWSYGCTNILRVTSVPRLSEMGKEVWNPSSSRNSDISESQTTTCEGSHITWWLSNNGKRDSEIVFFSLKQNLKRHRRSSPIIKLAGSHIPWYIPGLITLPLNNLIGMANAQVDLHSHVFLVEITYLPTSIDDCLPLIFYWIYLVKVKSMPNGPQASLQILRKRLRLAWNRTFAIITVQLQIKHEIVFLAYHCTSWRRDFKNKYKGS